MSPQTVVEPAPMSFRPTLVPDAALAASKAAHPSSLPRDSIPAHVPPALAGAPAQSVFEPRTSGEIATLCAGLGDRAEIEAELDEIMTYMRSFYLLQPDEIMTQCSAYTARLSELCVLLHRAEPLSNSYTRVRTMQVERILTELDRQFKTASRLLEGSRQNLAMMGGQV